MLKYLPWLIAAALFIAVVVLIVKQSRLKKDIDTISNGINSFINDNVKTELSIYDNDFARLQNGIVDLEEIIHLERSKTARENKKNTEFVSDVSHQLKTPIAALKLYCEMDYEKNPNEHIHRELQLIDKMEKLVYQLLRLEKIRLDSYNMNFKYGSIEKLAAEVVNDFRVLFPSKRFVVSGRSSLRFDEEWMNEAFANIIKNACEHTPDDGIIIVSISENQRSTIVEISDNGGGIKDDEIPNLFTRFYKSENASPNNTGIGLSISKAIIDKHHGIISAENKNGGLCFTICLPHIDGYETI